MTLEAVGLSKRVNEGSVSRWILRDVNFTVRPGEVLAVVGESGSGKSTLLSLLGVMSLPTEGEVRLDGEAISRLRDHHRAEVRRKRIGFLFQDFGLLTGMTVLENVMLPCIPDGRVDRDTQHKGRKILEELGISALEKKLVDGLSGGEQQRVALARVLLQHPDVLLLDEPSAHLDASRTQGLLDSLTAHAERGCRVVFTTHDPRLHQSAQVTRVLSLDEKP